MFVIIIPFLQVGPVIIFKPSLTCENISVIPGIIAQRLKQFGWFLFIGFYLQVGFIFSYEKNHTLSQVKEEGWLRTRILSATGWR